MSTIDKILELLKQQNKKQKDLTDFLGITKNAFTDWKSGRIKSYQKYLPQIADFFNVSVDYLVGNEENHLNTGLSLSSDERMLLEIYRSFPLEERSDILNYLRFKLDELEYKNFEYDTSSQA